MKIGVVQMASGSNKKNNLDYVEKQIDELGIQNCELIVLPEYFNYLGSLNDERENAESRDGITVRIISQKAKKHNIYIHLGSFLEKDEDKIYNTSLVFNPNGDIIASYRKIHLFDVNVPGEVVHMESEIITAGDKVATFQINDVVFGMATCYDLRFPELFRRLSDKGASVFIIPSAFHLSTGKDHWQVLLRARAIENQSFVIAPAQWKGISTHICYGRSMVIDPWGIIIAQASDKQCNLVEDIDLLSLKHIRKKLPALQHIRRDIFTL